MPRRLKLAVTSFNITAVLIIILGIILIFWGTRIQGSTDNIPLFLTLRMALPLLGLILIVLLGPFFRIVAVHLENQQYWAWFAGLILAVSMALIGIKGFSIIAALGGIALWGLLDTETLRKFVP